MNVTTIEMTPAQAREKLDAWLQEHHADQAHVKAQCLAGYQALADGKTLVHLDGSIRGGGFHASGYPKLAVARADRERVRFRWGNTAHLATFDARQSTWASPAPGPASLIRQIDMRRTPNVQRGNSYVSLDAWAQVPLLPAEHRPPARPAPPLVHPVGSGSVVCPRRPGAARPRPDAAEARRRPALRGAGRVGADGAGAGSDGGRGRLEAP